MLKNYQIILCSCLLAILLFNACKSSDDSPEPMAPREFADVEADFQAMDLTPGVHDVRLEMLNGVFYDFRYIVPETTPGEDRPLIMTFHGASTSPDAHKFTACYAEPGLDTLKAFIISPNAEGGLWYTDFNQQMVGNLVFLARKFWSIDDEKIAVTGYSNGGNASWLFSKFQSSTISAAIPMASSYDVNEEDGTVAVWQVPVYAIHGENDELFPVDTTRAWVAATNNAGSDVTLVVAEGLGHYTPCEYVPYLKEAAIWLKETVWEE